MDEPEETVQLLREQLRKEEALFEKVVDCLPLSFFLLDGEMRVTRSNAAFRRMFIPGSGDGDASGSDILSMVHEEDREALGEMFRRVLTGEEGEASARVTSGEKIRNVVFTARKIEFDSGSAIAATGTDVTEILKGEEKSLLLAAIVDHSDDVIISKTLDGIITSWNKGAEKIYGYREEEVLGKPVTILVPHGHEDEIAWFLERIRSGGHIDHYETVRRKKNGRIIPMSVTISPVKDRQGRIFGASTIGRDITDLKKAERLRLENARMNRELELARDIQQALLPICKPELPGLLFSCRCIPAAEVGGDYYDFFYHDGGILDAVIADVAGHNIGSALIMTVVRSMLHGKVDSRRSPATVLQELNSLLHSDLGRAGLQISMSYIRLDTKNFVVTWANAGHPPPLLFHGRRHAFAELDAEGLLMGVEREVVFEERQIGLEPGDLLVLFTDGIIEAESASFDFFGSGRLRDVIARNSGSHPNEIIDAILLELASFIGKTPLADDVAIAVIKLDPDSGALIVASPPKTGRGRSRSGRAE